MKAVAVVVMGIALLACAEDRVVQPENGDAGSVGGPDARPGPRFDAAPGTGECDMTGEWVVAQVTFSEALGQDQKSVNWFYHRIEQTGATFTIADSYNCGFRVTGTTTVTLKDATLEALATHNSSSVGRGGTFTESGGMCVFDLERTYNIRGADKDAFLWDHWSIGDPDKELNTFPTLPGDAAAGMQDWDSDGHEGFTLVTGLGERYVAQRDWNSHSGYVPKGATEFGGEGVVVVEWDGQEAVSTETPPLLRTTSLPLSPGWAYWGRVDAMVEIVTTGDSPVLDTCKNVQRAALEMFPDA